jgi:hypothetical protein
MYEQVRIANGSDVYDIHDSLGERDVHDGLGTSVRLGP